MPLHCSRSLQVRPSPRAGEGLHRQAGRPLGGQAAHGGPRSISSVPALSLWDTWVRTVAASLAVGFSEAELASRRQPGSGAIQGIF